MMNVRSLVILAALFVLAAAPASFAQAAPTPATATPAAATPSSDSSSSPATADAAPKPSVITRPDWLRKPSASQLSREYPPRAKYEGKSGRVVLRCEVTSSGSVTNCIVRSETPEGYGFGSAALRLSKYFAMRPKTVDGVAVGGAMVNIALPFNMK